MKTRKKPTKQPKPSPRNHQPPTLHYPHQKTHLSTRFQTHLTQEETSISFKNRHKALPKHPTTPRNKQPSRKLQVHRSLSPKINNKTPKNIKSFSPPLQLFKQNKGHKRKNSNIGCERQKNTVVVVSCPRRQFCQHPHDRKQYESFLIREGGDVTITQRSSSSEVSPKIEHSINLQKLISQTNNTTRIESLRTGKGRVNSMGDLWMKIKDKYSNNFPFLNKKEIKFFCGIVLVQRLWRQKKIKNMISNFICLQKSPVVQKKNLDEEPSVPTTQLIEKYKEVKKQDQEVCENNSLDEESKQKWLDLANSLKQVSKKDRKGRGWVTNKLKLSSPYSERCLIHDIYSSIIGKNRTEGIRILDYKDHLTIQEKKQQRKQPLPEVFLPLRQYPSEQIPDYVYFPRISESQERVRDLSVQTISFGDETTLDDMRSLSDSIFDDILLELTTQYRILVATTMDAKKRRNQIPGVNINQQYIRRYLTGVTEYSIQSCYSDIIRSFNNIQPQLYLKLHNQYDQQQGMETNQLQEYFNDPILPKPLFYTYQLIYEEEVQQSNQQQNNHSNFISTLIKLGNLMLFHTLSELIQRQKMKNVILPWENLHQSILVNHNIKSQEQLKNKMHKIIENVIRYSKKYLGLSPFETIQEQLKINQDIRQDYKWIWNIQDEAYQLLDLQLEIVRQVEGSLIRQFLHDFFHM